MAKFMYVVAVECETVEQADAVMAERFEVDEDYGFPYVVEYGDGSDGVERVEFFRQATDGPSGDDELAAAWDVASWVEQFSRGGA